MAENKLNNPDWTKPKKGAGYGTGSRGTPLVGAPTKRQAAKEEAKQLGIDTSGMSTKEIKAAIEDTREQASLVAEEMSKFIFNTNQDFSSTKKGDDLNATRTPATTTNRITEERASRLVASGQASPSRPPTQDGGGVVFEFPPAGWTTLTVTLCKDNNPAEAVILAQDPFATP